MKKRIKLNENILRRIIRENLNEFVRPDADVPGDENAFPAHMRDTWKKKQQGQVNEEGETPWINGLEDDYHKDHILYGKQHEPFFQSTFEFDKALDADTPEEYDKIMADREDHLHLGGENAQNTHPQCTPFGKWGDGSSFATSAYPNDEDFDPNDKWSSPSVHGMTYRDHFPQETSIPGSKIDEAVRKSIRKVVKEESETPWRDGFENEYNRDHVTFGRHNEPFFYDTFEYDDALDADTPEEYDKLMADREDHLRGRGELAQSHHPQCTPFAKLGMTRSFDTSDYPDNDDFDPNYKYSYPSISGRKYRERFSNENLDEAIRRSIKRVLGKK